MGNTIKSIILEEVVKDDKGIVIATKELINEVTLLGEYSECVMREVIKLKTGRVVIDQVLHKVKFKNNSKCQAINLVTGFIEQGGDL